jgi:hypothetical protein
VKKQQEPTFPELEAWCVGSSQATASEAAACAASIALAAPENATVVAPSSLVASCLAFDTKSLGRNRRVVSVTEAASDALTFEDGEDGVCVCIVFDPRPSAVLAERTPRWRGRWRRRRRLVRRASWPR